MEGGVGGRLDTRTRLNDTSPKDMPPSHTEQALQLPNTSVLTINQLYSLGIRPNHRALALTLALVFLASLVRNRQVSLVIGILGDPRD
jgi:hypothetical protein